MTKDQLDDIFIRLKMNYEGREHMLQPDVLVLLNEVYSIRKDNELLKEALHEAQEAICSEYCSLGHHRFCINARQPLGEKE